MFIPVHRHEIYEEIKSSMLGAAESEKVDMDGIRKKIDDNGGGKNGKDDHLKGRGQGGG